MELKKKIGEMAVRQEYHRAGRGGGGENLWQQTPCKWDLDLNQSALPSIFRSSFYLDMQKFFTEVF